ncbi:hypothetical protein MUY14_02645 [Amycolatopsis sp. FBCC-B4732]|uniref:aa3-type cytochrome oxidase subunit CtaJ n=1 Tax=Amycolatopsis sp. FBCC-B4732 TaxID=3079339 RepID=UPI001FF53504|nr:hypothetical protein [Amycolatopsis sp. FBCC-B4732]UOX89561.1 hypothetical protein MUY14_02645 [Amycolatopsis sp. FBCC-B4732]
MNVVETIVVFAVIPLAIYGLAGLLTLRRRSGGAPRYRSGQAWEYPAMWWSANPDGVGEGHRHAGAEAKAPSGAATAAGGARGNW